MFMVRSCHRKLVCFNVFPYISNEISRQTIKQFTFHRSRKDVTMLTQSMTTIINSFGQVDEMSQY